MSNFFYKSIEPYFLPIILILFWELMVFSSDPPVYLPPISSVVSKLIYLLTTKEFLVHVIYTLYRCTLGFLIAVLIATPFGILLGMNKKLYRLCYFMIEFFRPLPSASIIPIAILFLGIYDTMKVFIIVFGSMWPILINTIDGVRGLDNQFLKVAKVFGVDNKKILKKIIFPLILPNIFTGIKVSIAISLILAITVEMIIGGEGIGFFILDAERGFQFKEMYAGVLLIGIIGYLVNTAFLILEKSIIFWR